MTQAEAQIRVQSELQVGETLVWSGVPDARRAALSAIPETILPGVLFGGVGLFIMIYEYTGTPMTPKASSHPLSPVLGMLVFGLPFLLAGLINLLRPLWVYRRGLLTAYGVTSDRVLIISGNTSKSVRSLGPADIYDVGHRERRDGSGEVMIRTQFSVHSRNDLARKRNWLFGVPNVREVALAVAAVQARPIPG